MRINKTEFLAAAAAVILAIPPLVSYHIVSPVYPLSDDAGYMTLALLFYRRFLSNGFFGGLVSLYTLRQWKPIFHPLLGLPALILTRGHVISAQAITVVGLYALLAVAMYALARAYLNRLDSVLAAGLVVVIPWLHLEGYTFNSELPFGVFFLGAWAALLHSDGLKKKWLSALAAVCAGLAVCIRPAESVLFFAILLPAYSYYLLKSERISLKELIGCAIMVALILVPVIGIKYYSEGLPWQEAGSIGMFLIMAAAIAAACALYVFRFRKNGKSNFQWFVLTFSAIPAVWFSAFLPHVFSWMAGSSFRSGGFTQLDRVGVSDLYARLETAFSGNYTPVLLALAVASAWNAFKVPASPGVPKLRGALGMLILLFAVHFCLGARSYNSVVRYYVIEVAALYLGAVVLFLRLPNPLLRWPKRVVVAGAIGAQLFAYAPAYGLMKPGAGVTDFGAKLFAREGIPLPLTWGDPALSLYKNIEADLQTKERPSVYICYTSFTHSMNVASFSEPGTLDLIALDHSHEIHAQSWGTLQTRNGVTQYENLENSWKADFIVAGPIENAEPGIMAQLKSLGGTWRTFTMQSDAGPNRSPVNLTMALIKR